MPTARRGVHAAHPAAKRETDDGEGAALVSAETIAERLLEPTCDGVLVGSRARPGSRLTRRPGGHGQHVVVAQGSAATQVGQRILVDVVLLVDQREALEIVDRADGARRDAMLREKGAIRR